MATKAEMAKLVDALKRNQPRPTTQQNVLEFMQDIYRMTIPNPFAEFERVWEMRAALEISPFNGRIRLGCIRSLERGKGWGSDALRWLCTLADRYGVDIEGSIQPVGNIRPRLSKPQLKAWYRRHGFEVNKYDDIFRKAKQ